MSDQAAASLPRGLAAPGTRLQMEWTVDGRRTTVGATVTPLPFYDPPHRRA